ncbi:hypothetical protein [Melaminivora alkalimesophila]|uniref:Uncharacterized protein n=1 Tax=Melaminivora alkalimesophila TaxID=1165852 RepID=A0A317RCP1_9BURK|nr:hypothetical protein [Melaminivora alkalimesophila]PWW45885.1 hypothetical protein DFR36_10588 [Melaminivora alkalimesophila]
MATAQPTYHAPTFVPTVDELETLKRLELEPTMALPEALRQHLSGRLLEWGLIQKTPTGQFSITDQGRRMVQRREG